MDYRIQDLIDIPLFQTLQDRLNEIYSFPSAIIDNDGNILTATAWQDVCTKFHRVHPECERECRASDQYILSHLAEASPAVTYRCPHGLVDNATPIVVAGKHVGNFFTGQFFLEVPDLEFFRTQARRYGFDEQAYLDAVRRVPVWSEQKLAQYLDFIKGFVEILAGIGYRNLQDIESRRLLEEKDTALEETHNFNQQVIESVDEGLFVYDAGLRCTVWNPFMERLSGVPACDVLGHRLGDAFPFLRDAGIDRRLKAALNGEPQAAFDFEYKTSDGRSEWLSDTSAPIRGRDGTIIGVITTVRDVTDRRRAEATLSMMQKLESLGTLAGGIAHDFNNIVTAILGNLSLLAHEVADPGARELIREATEASLTARGLAQQLLTFASGGDPVVRLLDLANLLRDVAAFAARGSSARCAFAIGGERLPVRADREQLAQVIQNLVLNAVQAMPHGGTITVEASMCELATGEVPPLAAGPYVRVAIRDSGTGIPREHLDRIFDPYFTTKSRGRGLGLAVCHSIVAKHGGQITAESRPGSGAVFTIDLPAVPGAEIAETRTASPAAARRARLLVMDDDESVLRLLRRILERLGHDVELVPDGGAALDAYRGALASPNPFAAVVMDLTIAGGMGGRETLRKLIEIDPSVRAIVSSGYSNDPIMSDWAAAGFSGVLPKPYRLEDVTRVLGEVLGGPNGAATSVST